MQRVTIVGLGHVGASLGLALKRWTASSGGRAQSQIEVVGFDYDNATQKAAEKLGAVDRTYWGLSRSIGDAALVVLSVPVGQLEGAIREVAPYLSGGAIVTDTAPAKRRGLAWAAEHLPSHAAYIGGHPILATPPEGGAPSADVFGGVTYGLFPQPDAGQASTEVVVGLVQAIGARPYFADAAEFDAQVAVTTLLPALAASTLMHAASQTAAWRDTKANTTGDLREVTRLAETDPTELRDILTHSRQEGVRWLDELLARLGEVRDLAAREDAEADERLLQLLADAHAARAEWLLPDGRAQAGVEERRSLGDQFTQMLLGGRRRPRE